MKILNRRIAFVVVMALGFICSARVDAQLLNDPLQGSTLGTRSGGSFEAGGWKITNNRDYIYWHLPSSLNTGAVEFYVKGLIPRDPPQVNHSDNNLFEMYDYTYDNADTNYNGFRNNPYKVRVNKNGPDYDYNGTTDACQITWLFPPDDPEVEWESPNLTWDPQINYKFRVEWGPPSGGSTTCKVLRNDVLIWQRTLLGTYAPTGHAVRLGWSTRPDDYSPLNAVFSNFKVYNSLTSTPGAPTIITPTSGQTINTNLAYITWNGDSHSQYEVQVNTVNQPDTGIAWTSGTVNSDRNYAWSGTLFNNSTYYAFVRLANGAQFGNWSAGRQFTVNRSFVPPGADVIKVQGNSVVQKSGPFLGLGVSYMQALRRCKYDRPRYLSDLAFLSAREFKYNRILSMVGWYSAWQGKEIAPISFTSQNGTFVPAWPDYWQQFKDCIDIAYDQYGMRSEITIFADAQLIPNKPDRINHMQTMLNNLVGREHKVMHLEVANEAWQNGFPGAQGIADLREFCQYLTDRTTIPVAISSPEDTTDGGIMTMYAGSTADIATVHFDRDISSIEDGWRPVRDCYRTGVSGIAPMSANEPIGPGSSVASETDPIKLVMAAAFTWGAGLPLYVYHTDAGVFGITTFESKQGVGDYIHLNEILPPDLASWVRNDGKESASPFTSYSNGQANKWWPEISSSASGVVRNTGAIKGGEFVTFPIGVQSTGVELAARRPMAFQVYDPLTGQIVYNLTKNAGDHFTLAQGPRAYIIRGAFTDVINPSSDVSVDLGNLDVTQGLAGVVNADGDTAPATIGGRNCRVNVNPAQDFYYYFNVSETWAYQGNKPSVYIIADYYDAGTSSLTLEYDAIGPNVADYYKNGGSVALTNTNTWKHHTWHVTDAYFGNRQNGGADFRIGNVGNIFYLDVVRVTTDAPVPPIIAAVTPNPELVLNGTLYAKQLTLTQGSPDPTWSMLQGPPGLAVNAAGLVSGWTPGAGVFGNVTIQVQASNSEGTDTETWTVQVLSRIDFDQDGDVDITDFAHMQACFSGDALPYRSGCADADLNGDGDVDNFDFNAFLPCMTGADHMPGC